MRILFFFRYGEDEEIEGSESEGPGQGKYSREMVVVTSFADVPLTSSQLGPPACHENVCYSDCPETKVPA